MIPTSESDFAEAHELFHRGHAEQRARLMAALSQSAPGRAKQSSRATIPLPVRLTAACLLFAATVALLSLSYGNRAYGIDGLKERLLTIRSLHLKGWIWQYTKTDAGKTPLAFPTELYFERPYRQYRTGYGFSNNGRKLTVASRVFVSDGDQTMLLDQNKKTATLAATDKLHSELVIEGFLQNRLFEQLGMRDLDEFDRAGVDRVKGVVCDVYDRRDSPVESMKCRTRIWLNPQDGMPVKVASYDIDRTGKEEISWEWTEIGINVEPPEGMFSFQAPDGYERVEPEPTSGFNTMATLTGSGGSTTKDGTKVSLSSGVAIKIDDKGILHCWSLQISGKDGPQLLEFSLSGAENRPCEEITLRTDNNGEYQERWSLIVPRDRKTLGNASLSMIHRSGGNTVSMHSTPLEFPPKRLTEIVEECQRRTLPANHDAAEIWTLEEVRQELAEVR